MPHTFILHPSTRIARLYPLVTQLDGRASDCVWYALWRIEFFSTWQASFLIAVNVPTLLTGILPMPSSQDLEERLAWKIRMTLARGGLVTGPDPARPFLYQKLFDRSLNGSIHEMTELACVRNPISGTDTRWIEEGEALINRTKFRYLKGDRPKDVFLRHLRDSGA